MVRSPVPAWRPAVLLPLVLAAGTLLLFSACSASSGGQIHIYSSVPLQGTGGSDNQSVVDAIRDAINDHGGKAGPYTVSYISLDDSTAARGEWDPDRETQNARTAIADPRAVAVIGPLDSGAAEVSAPILNRAGMALISPAATSPGLTKTTDAQAGEPYVYAPLGPSSLNFCRTTTTDDIQGVSDAEYAQQSLSAKNVFVVDDTQPYGKGIATIFRAKLQSLNVPIAGSGELTQDTNKADFARQIAATNPDLVYYGGIAENGAADLLAALRTAGFKGSFMGPDGIDESSFAKAAQASGGTIVSTVAGLPPDQLKGAGATWYTAYKQKHSGKDPGPYAANAYDATVAVLNAAAKAPPQGGGTPSRAAVLAALRGTQNLQGITGTWSFNQSCDTTLTTISVLKVQNGDFVYAGTAPPPQ